MKPRILILSAYHADSHAHWVEQLVAGVPEVAWTVLTLPGRYFAWRVRGNSMSWAFGDAAETLEADYDLILATSMVDLSALRGFVPKLASVPTLVYFHENQFAYPASGHALSAVEPQMLSIYTALCADRLLFNSEFNRQSFMAGAQALLKKLPDQVPRGLVERLEARASVLPVPLSMQSEPVESKRPPLATRPIRLVWNARWEYDKAPDRLLRLLCELEGRGVAFELALLGQSFRSVPPEFEQIRHQFSAQITQYGYVDSREGYLQWLAWADLVVSTALHEFQGLAVLEAVSMGAIPLLPDRQVYRELFPAEFLYASDLKDPEREARAAAERLAELRLGVLEGELSPPNVSRFSTEQLLPHYRDLILELCATQ